jgi:hypothetical protein
VPELPRRVGQLRLQPTAAQGRHPAPAAAVPPGQVGRRRQAETRAALGRLLDLAGSDSLVQDAVNDLMTRDDALWWWPDEYRDRPPQVTGELFISPGPASNEGSTGGEHQAQT